MTSKLKCPFCGEELDWCLSCPLPTMSCPNHNCKAYDFLMTQNCWRELIQAKQDLEKSEECCSAWERQALDYKAETIALSGKLEIAVDALNAIIATPLNSRVIHDTADKALAQITHDNSEKANSVEHKETQAD